MKAISFQFKTTRGKDRTRNVPWVLLIFILFPYLVPIVNSYLQHDICAEIEECTELYLGNDVMELLGQCVNSSVQQQHVTPAPSNATEEEEDDDDDDDEELKQTTQCVPLGECMSGDCNEYRLDRLRDAQKRTKDMLKNLDSYVNILWQISVFVLVLLLGLYLIAMNHFKWRTLPLIGNQFEDDPTDGYRYSHFMWMQWITLDSDNPTYYRDMTPETHEIEYLPQFKQWEDPQADSDEDFHPAWSIRDIYDMTADPDERLESYFRRIQQEVQTSQQGRSNIKKFKKKFAR